MELGPLHSASSSASSLPQYEAIVDTGSSSIPDSTGGSFYPSVRLQIETAGIGLFRLPLPPRNIPIPVYAVDEDGQTGGVTYESIRPTRGSGNCVLYRRDGGQGGSAVCATTYRFGPNRPPIIQLLADGYVPGSDDDNNGSNNSSKNPEGFEVHGKGIATRAVSIRTSMGTFQWRYASRAERKAFQGPYQEVPNSLLVMDRVHSVALAGNRKSSEERLRTVAVLVRGESTRTRGTGSSSAGNGGRLMVDLRDYAAADAKGEAAQMEAFVVASCLVMLKREVDRRRLQQAMMISAGASGGP
jgi:hypothetical protein